MAKSKGIRLRSITHWTVLLTFFLSLSAGAFAPAQAQEPVPTPTPTETPRKRSRKPKPPEKEAAEIPQKPSAPPVVDNQQPPEFYHCQRLFSWKGKVLGCDSNIRLDGEKLRPIIGDTKLAVQELDSYQKTRAGFKTAAYIGTAGVVVMLLGSAVAPTPELRRLAVLAGGGIAAGGLIFTFSAIQANENHLKNAVRYYNEAHPETPIELMFNTEIRF